MGASKKAKKAEKEARRAVEPEGVTKALTGKLSNKAVWRSLRRIKQAIGLD